MTILRPTIATLVAWLAVLSASPAATQPAVQTATELRPETVGADERFHYEIDITVEGNFPIELNEEFDHDELELLGRTATPSGEVRAGRPVRSVTLEYELQAPFEPGEYRITAPEFRVGDRLIRPDETTLRVIEQSADERITPRIDRSDEPAFVAISVDPDRDPFVGEQMAVSLDLYIHRDERNLRARPPGEPALDDFWIEDLRDDVDRHRSQRRRDGQLWYVTPLHTWALFPLRPGTTTIDAIDVPLATASLFGDRQELNVESPPVDLDVRPLPPDSPAGFSSGNVGDFSFSVDVDTRTATAGEVLTLTATIDGPGRATEFGDPSFDLPDTVRHIDTTVDTAHSIRRHRLHGTRTVAYELMPTEEGRLELPPLTFSYFDPDTESYVTETSEPVAVDVEPGDVPPPAPEADEPPVAETTDAPAAELASLRSPGSFAPAPSSGSPPGWSFILPLIGLLLLGLERIVAGPGRRSLLPRLKRYRLRRRLRQILGDDETPADTRSLNALRLVLTEQLDVAPGTITAGEIATALAERGLPPELVTDTTDLIDELETARYAPDPAVATDLIERTRSVTDQLLDRAATDDGPSSNATAATKTLIGTLLVAAIMTVGAGPPPESIDDDEPPMTADDARPWSDVATYWSDRAAGDDDPTHDYNAGTAYFHAGDIGRARLHLERARVDGASSAEIDGNFELVSDAIAGPRADSTFLRQQRPAQTLSAIGPWLALVALWIASVAALSRRLVDRPPFAVIIAALLLAAISWSLSASVDAIYDTDLGVVTDDGHHLLRGPTDEASTASDTTLPPGAMFRIDDRRNGWYEIELPSGDTGWIATSAGEKLAPAK